jgi:hypothetical protein
VTASIAPGAAAAARFIASWRSPDLARFVRTLPGRIALLFLSAMLLRPFTEAWPVVITAVAAMSFTNRRNAATITALATLTAFAAAPDWYGLGAPNAFAQREGLSDWLTPSLRWGAPTILLCFAALFFAAVRAGRPRWVARHPFLSLLAVLFALVTAAQAGPGSAGTKLWLWSLVAALSGYMWFIALVATEQRNSNNRVPFLHQFGVLHPFWGSTGTPYTVAPNRLAKLAASDDEALAISQIKGFKLLVWAYLIVIIQALYTTLVHKSLAIPTYHDALATYLGAGLPWHLRWLSLISDFFEAIIRLAAFGHLIIGCARLAGYNLLRNTYRPFSSRSIAEFWGRYYFYFKELLLTLFYFPTYLSCFRNRPRLRSAFATFMAAGVGNGLFHFIREIDQIPTRGFWPAVTGFQTYSFYCVMLAAGISFSQLRGQRRRAADESMRARILPFASVMTFYCLLQVFDDTNRTISLADHMRFFFSLFIQNW